MPHSPILSPDALRPLAQHILELSTANTVSVDIEHRALGTAHVARGIVEINESGDRLWLQIALRFGRRASMSLRINQIDSESLRQAVRYLEQVALEQVGDPIDIPLTVPPRTYLPNTTWYPSGVHAFDDARHAAIETLVSPLRAAGLTTSAFVGVMLRSRLHADKRGIVVAGQETDNEVTVTAWNPDGKGSGWAGQAAREWSSLDLAALSDRVIHLTKLSANPVTVEPGRRTVILDRPAVVQFVSGMGWAFSAGSAFGGGPLYDRAARRPRLGERIFDARITLSSDPNDPEGGYLPFNGSGLPLVAMRWVKPGGVLEHLAYSTEAALQHGVSPANDPPESLRLECAPRTATATVEEMIANCKDGIYVNRLAGVNSVSDSAAGMQTGVTNGGCFLIRNGKIDKPIVDLRFVESPWLMLNRVEAIGTAQRTARGYGGWPTAPTIVPPLMIRDFNFAALAAAV